jgi:hypothetical protein
MRPPSSWWNSWIVIEVRLPVGATPRKSARWTPREFPRGSVFSRQSPRGPSVCRRSTSALQHIEQCGDMGSIPPPTSTPIWAWCRGSQPDAVATAAGGHHHAPGWCLRRSWCHGSVLWRQCPAQPAGSPGTGLWGIGCVIRTAQVTGPFSPLVVIGTIPRDMKGPPQVHPRSVRGRRKRARTGRLEAGLSAAGRCILQSIRGPGEARPADRRVS